MSDFPRMLYRGGPYADWAALGDALRANKVETVTAADADDEAARRAAGFGDVDSILVKPKAKKAKD